jgi:predicted aminopeptidase
MNGALFILRRQPIDTVITNPSTPVEIQRKLNLIKAARHYAISRGLTPYGSFTYYTEVKGDAVSWLVTAVKKGSFVPKTWWFPFVGTVPYKGFFSKNEADHASNSLIADNYDTNVRVVEAYSTLGWFDDPVPSLLLKRSDIQLVENVIHEIVHSTVWIPNQVSVNESLAQYIALRETIRFFLDSSHEFYSINTADTAKNSSEKYILSAKRFEQLFRQLLALYEKQEISAQKKEEIQKELYQQTINDVRTFAPQFVFVEAPNNAALLDVILYLQGYDLWSKMYDKYDGEIPKIMSKVQSFAVKYTEYLEHLKEFNFKSKSKHNNVTGDESTATPQLIDFIRQKLT